MRTRRKVPDALYPFTADECNASASLGGCHGSEQANFSKGDLGFLEAPFPQGVSRQPDRALPNFRLARDPGGIGKTLGD